MYPRCPRQSLRVARDMVQAVCEEHGVEYHETGFFNGNVELVKSMAENAYKARTLKRNEHGLYDSMLWEGLNAIG